MVGPGAPLSREPEGATLDARDETPRRNRGGRQTIPNGTTIFGGPRVEGRAHDKQTACPSGETTEPPNLTGKRG